MPYDFTRSVQDPRDIYPQGYGATQDSTAAAVGTAMSGLANIFDMGIKAAAENKLDKRLGEFESEINPYVQAVGQGRMESNDAMARTTAKIKTYIDRYPHLADDLRKRAQDIWGVNPSGELLKHAQDKEAMERKRKQDVDNGHLTVAAQFGAIPTDEVTGQPDYASGIEVGRELSGYMANLEAAMKEVNLKKGLKELNADGKGASLVDQQKLRAMEALRYARPLIQSSINAKIRSMPGLLNTLENPKDADSLAVGQRMVEQAYTTDRTAITTWINDQEDMDPQTVKEVYETLDLMYSDYRGKTPATIANAGKILDMQAYGVRADAWKYMKPLMAADALIGDGPTAMAVRAVLLAPTEGGAKRLVDQSKMVEDFFGRYERVLRGNPPPTDTGDPGADIALANGNRAGYQEAIKNPEGISKERLPGTVNSLNFTMDKAIESNDPSDFMAATADANNAASARVLERLKTVDPDLHEKTVDKIVSLNGLALQSYALQAQKTETATSGTLLDKISSGLLQGDTGTSQDTPAQTKATMGLAYDARTGAMQVVGVKTGVKVPENLQRLQGSINSSLRALIRYKDQTPDHTRDMSDQEFKMKLIEGLGFQIIGKTAEQTKAKNKSGDDTVTADIYDDGIKVEIGE